MKAIAIDKLLVKDIMTQSPLTADKGETVSQMISKMRKNKVREIPIVEGGKPLGLISYKALLARRNVPLTAKVEHIMIPCPNLEEDMSILHAAEELMLAGVRGAPVVRNRKMVGFLSRTDIVRILPQVDELKGRQVQDFMSKTPQSVTEKETIRKAQIIMKGLDEKGLPVVDDIGLLIGAIGMTEIMDVMWSPKASKPPNEIKGSDREAADIRVGSVMNRSPVYISPTDTVEKAVSIMLKKNLSTLFVTDGNKLIGVVSQFDLMEQVISLKPREGVYVQITGLDFDDPEVYDVLYELIGKAMKRIDRFESPRVFTLHASVHHPEGLKSKYGLGARLTTAKNMYYGKIVDWDLYKAADELLNTLEKNVKRDHEKRLDLVKKRK
ncbi:MAG: CBS domain-containing protein [Candidatus Thermoplasmatota archaeon]|nr:CBS domain-containing protein [Candidatus Thermoplasmatota archaeon]